MGPEGVVLTSVRLLQDHLQVVGPVPGEPGRHGRRAAVLRERPGLPVPGAGALLPWEHPEGNLQLGCRLIFCGSYSQKVGSYM